jgi:hypothetical protein
MLIKKIKKIILMEKKTTTATTLYKTLPKFLILNYSFTA